METNPGLVAPRAETLRFLVYGLVDPRDGSIRYVGRSHTGSRRPWSHHSHPSAGEVRRAWLAELEDAGLRCQIVILGHYATFDEAADAEVEWMQRGLGLGWPLTNHFTDKRMGGRPGQMGWRERRRAEAEAAALLPDCHACRFIRALCIEHRAAVVAL